MQGQLSQKERMLLEDLKQSENLCVVKYQSYAQQAKDSQLSQLFNKIAGQEQEHYDTVNQLLQSGGQAQSGGQKGQSGGQGGQQKSGGAQSAAQINLSQGVDSSNSDKYLLQDMLTTEKQISSSYDTSVFESGNTNVRQALQHIQQEEQNHGEQLFQYMSSHGMYQPQ